MFDSLFELSLRQLHLLHHHVVLLFTLQPPYLVLMQLGQQLFTDGLLCMTHRFHYLFRSHGIQRLLSVVKARPWFTFSCRLRILHYLTRRTLSSLFGNFAKEGRYFLRSPISCKFFHTCRILNGWTLLSWGLFMMDVWRAILILSGQLFSSRLRNLILFALLILQVFKVWFRFYFLVVRFFGCHS